MQYNFLFHELFNEDTDNFKEFYKKHREIVKEIIINTLISIKEKKLKGLFSENDINVSTKVLHDIINKLDNISIKNTVQEFQNVMEKLSIIISGLGTKFLNDLLYTIGFHNVCENLDTIIESKYLLLKKHFSPSSFHIYPLSSKVNKQNNTVCNNKLCVDDISYEIQDNFECNDSNNDDFKFFQRIYGVILTIHNFKTKKTVVINGVINDISCLHVNNKYIDYCYNEIVGLFEDDEIGKKILENATIQDLLIYSPSDFIKKKFSILNEINIVKKNKLDTTIDKFNEMSIINQRSMLINLMLYNKQDDVLFICNILYEIIAMNSSVNNNYTDLLLDSFPWGIKQMLKECARFSINYNHEMRKKYDTHNISLEHQIYLLKVNDNVKEKALAKYKEVQSKNDDSMSKAKQYLEGLIKIPFEIFKEEKVLILMKTINEDYIKLLQIIKIYDNSINIKNKYTNYEIMVGISNIINIIKDKVKYSIKQQLSKQTTNMINIILKELNKKYKITNFTTKSSKIDAIFNTIQYSDYDIIDNKINTHNSIKNSFSLINNINTNNVELKNGIQNMRNFLEDSIYSHKNAKTQLFKIIAQWINGNQSGYCFGFEGSPGIGKTSLAKNGLSGCLKDENGVDRPFSFIQLGGSSNGSSLEGHSYTYMNSTWGRIVDILMESKCMNPIIYIDELDKVSATEQGKEIIGILTHIIDSTQNSCFQDKYFSGIDIDLSKVLFIFSYNDPNKIDKILLDRIHRIKFDNLTTEDKIVIVKKYLLPDINKEMGFDDIININDQTIEYIIENYTCEPGIRKLKEIIFDVFGEINIEYLTNNDNSLDIPLELTIDIIENKYLSKYNKILSKRIHKEDMIGIINGLWANTLGKGGIIPIQAFYFPTVSFLELKLTGLQGDVMKESMNVAKTLAWNLTKNTAKKKLITYFNNTKCQGLHIHCPEGSISKDGPSAGAAITIAIYSLLNDKKIPNDVAITGEITLDGNVTAIGGLYEKISGGIKAGIKTFIVPAENKREYDEVVKKYQNKHIDINSKVNVNLVNHINDIFKILKL